MSKKVFQGYSNGMFTDYIFSLDTRYSANRNNRMKFLLKYIHFPLLLLWKHFSLFTAYYYAIYM